MERRHDTEKTVPVPDIRTRNFLFAEKTEVIS